MSLSLCREPVVIEGEATLGIHSSVKGKGHEFTSGHAWITVLDKNNDLYYFGLWPDGHPRVSNSSEACTDVRIGMEAGVMPTVSRYYRLNQEQVAKLNLFINDPVAWRYTYNCSDWAVRLVGQVIGKKLNASDYVFFSTPRKLGQFLEKMELKQPTTATQPVYGPPVETQSSSFK
jgi:hypothetical protein